MKITGRDLKFFFLGAFVVLLIEIVFNWSDFKEGVREGYNAASDNTEVSE